MDHFESKIISDKNVNFTKFFRAAKHGHIHVLEFLYNHGFDVEPLTNDGKSPLHLAAKYGHCDLVNYLLQEGLHRHLKTRNGLTPYDYAKKGNHTAKL